MQFPDNDDNVPSGHGAHTMSLRSAHGACTYESLPGHRAEHGAQTVSAYGEHSCAM